MTGGERALPPKMPKRLPRMPHVPRGARTACRAVPGTAVNAPRGVQARAHTWPNRAAAVCGRSQTRRQSMPARAAGRRPAPGQRPRAGPGRRTHRTGRAYCPTPPRPGCPPCSPDLLNYILPAAPAASHSAAWQARGCPCARQLTRAGLRGRGPKFNLRRVRGARRGGPARCGRHQRRALTAPPRHPL